jgi:hypothetical protein
MAKCATASAQDQSPIVMNDPLETEDPRPRVRCGDPQSVDVSPSRIAYFVSWAMEWIFSFSTIWRR